MGYDRCENKGLERLEDDQSQEPKEDLFLNGFLIEFFNESFYCNKGKIELSEMINIIDMIDNLDNHYNGLITLFIEVFDMKISIIVFRQVYMQFYNRGIYDKR